MPKRMHCVLLGLLFSGLIHAGESEEKTSACKCDPLKVSVVHAGSRATSTVSIIEFSFQPAAINIAANDTVTWTNTGTTSHTVTSDTGLFDSGAIAPGASFSLMFIDGGTYGYHCSIHPTMTGTITVGTSLARDITGHFSGKAKARQFEITTETTKPLSAPGTADVVFTQTGNELRATFTLQTADGSEVFTMLGRTGVDNFYLGGANADSTKALVFSGHISKKADGVKGTAILYSNARVKELSINLKKQ
jgi:plastocyanin